MALQNQAEMHLSSLEGMSLMQRHISIIEVDSQRNGGGLTPLFPLKIGGLLIIRLK